MKNVLKDVLLAILGVISIAYILFLIVPFIISPVVNGYAPKLSDEIKKSTGLNSKLERVRIVTTPKLTIGLKVGDFSLYTPDDRLVMDADDFQVKMSLFPVFAKRIEADIVQLKNLTVNLGLNKDGSFEIEKYLPVQEPKEEKEEEENTVPFTLPFGLKLSNQMPNVSVGGYKITFTDIAENKDYVLQGNTTEINDFELGESIKVKSDGSFTLQDREQFKYNIHVNNRIMPQMDINELVFNPKPEEKPAEDVKINLLEILKGLYDNQITANLDAKIRIAKKGEHLNCKGHTKVNKLSVAPNGLKLPESDINLTFDGHRIFVKTNLYTAKDEKSLITGTVRTGKNPHIDMNIKSAVELANIVKIVNAVAMTFNIKDLQTLSASGKINADCTFMSDMKTVVSNGYLKIPSAKLYYGLYKVGVDNINADIVLNNNDINVNNVSFVIFNQPLKIYGKIKQDTTTDLHLTANALGLKGLLVACGQAALMKDNQINSGTVSLIADIVGKLDSIKPTAKISLNNLDIKSIPANTTLKLPKTDLNIISDGKTFSGTAVSTNIKVINPAATVTIPTLKANIKEDVIEIVQAPMTIEKIKLTVAGKIKNYLTEKILLDFVTTGDIKSTITGDVNMAKQTLNIDFSAPQNCQIIIPMFDKSKMIFRGNTSITGSMLNPILNGSFDIPAISIPEIPVVLDNMTAKLNGPILKGNATVGKFTSGGIVAQNLTTNFSMKGVNFYLNNLKGQAFDGNIGGNIVYNMSNAKTTIDFSGSGIDAEKAVLGAVGIKNALTGTMSFDTKLSLMVLDYNEMMKSMKGDLNFKIENGAFGTIGRLENFLAANNVVANTVLKTTVQTLSTLSGIKNSAKFDYITGTLAFKDGWANLNPIKSAGPTLAYYITGKYNLLNGTTNVNLLGRLDGSVVALLGPLGDVSASKLLGYIPKFGEKTAAIVNAMTANPRTENVVLIPALSNGSKSYKDFKVVFNGGLESKSSVKSFKWLTNVDMTEIEKIDVVDTVKSIKTTINTDVQTTVENAKKAVETAKQQQELIKNSAQEIINLFHK